MTETILIAGPQLSDAAMQIAARKALRVVSVRAYAQADEIAAAAVANEVGAIILRMGTITASVIEACPRLKVIVKHGVGVDGIDVDAATRFGIPVLITGGANSQSVAELAIALMFAAARSIPLLDRRIRTGHWDKATCSGVQLAGRALGIVGFGSIGRLLCSLVEPLRMSVAIHDPRLREGDVVPRTARVSTLEDILSSCDFVSLHCPLTAATRGMIGERQLRAMRRTAFLINTARGGLIDEAALATALSEGWIAGAALDTFSREPPSPDSPLWQLPTLVATPHIGASTADARECMGIEAMNQVAEFFEGKPVNPGNLVNPAALGRMTLEDR